MHGFTQSLILILISIIIIVTKIFFESYEEVFIWWKILLDDVLFNLALAMISSWIFWFIIVFLPSKKSEKSRIIKYNRILNETIKELEFFIKMVLWKKREEKINIEEIQEINYKNIFEERYNAMEDYNKWKKIVKDWDRLKIIENIEENYLYERTFTKPTFRFLEDYFKKTHSILENILISENFDNYSSLLNEIQVIYNKIDKNLYLFNILEENFYWDIPPSRIQETWCTKKRDFYMKKFNDWSIEWCEFIKHFDSLIKSFLTFKIKYSEIISKL